MRALQSPDDDYLRPVDHCPAQTDPAEVFCGTDSERLQIEAGWLVRWSQLSLGGKLTADIAAMTESIAAQTETLRELTALVDAGVLA